MIHYDGRLFHVVENSSAGEVTGETIFRYKQKEWIVTADYAGGGIDYGQIIGLVDNNGRLNFRYQHVNTEGFIMTGRCKSRPEILAGGKIRLHERWQWTCGSRKKGTSVLEEF